MEWDDKDNRSCAPVLRSQLRCLAGAKKNDCNFKKIVEQLHFNEYANYEIKNPMTIIQNNNYNYWKQIKIKNKEQQLL